MRKTLSIINSLLIITLLVIIFSNFLYLFLFLTVDKNNINIIINSFIHIFYREYNYPRLLTMFLVISLCQSIIHLIVPKKKTLMISSLCTLSAVLLLFLLIRYHITPYTILKSSKWKYITFYWILFILIFYNIVYSSLFLLRALKDLNINKSYLKFKYHYYSNKKNRISSNYSNNKIGELKYKLDLERIEIKQANIKQKLQHLESTKS